MIGADWAGSYDAVGRLVSLNRDHVVSESDPFTEGRYRQFSQLLPIGELTVLDVGCNTGRGGAVLKSRAPGIRLFGLELLGERATRIPDGIYEDVSIGVLDGYRPPVPGFDVILMGELIEHIPWDAFDDLLSNVHRLLRPGGSLMLTTPNPHYLLLRWKGNGTVLGGPHVSVHCSTALAQYLAFRGFAVEYLKGTGRVSQKLGRRMPLGLYGSHMVVARRRTDRPSGASAPHAV